MLALQWSMLRGYCPPILPLASWAPLDDIGVVENRVSRWKSAWPLKAAFTAYISFMGHAAIRALFSNCRPDRVRVHN